MRASRVAVVLLVGLTLVAGCLRRPQPTPTPVQPTPQTSTPAAGVVPSYDCQQIPPGKIRVDGVLNEPAWKKAAPIGPLTLWNGQPAKQGTKAELLWDKKMLYVAFICDDTDLEGKMRQRDQNLWQQNEVVEMFVDSAGDGTCYLEFEINPRNAVVDLVLPHAISPGPLTGKKCWDARGMKTAVKVRGTIGNRTDKDNGWTVEMAIPLQDFLTAPNVPPKGGDAWRINLYRVDDTQKKVEFQAWSPTNTEKPQFHVPERFGTVRFVALPGAPGATKAGETKAAEKAGATTAPAATKAGGKGGEGAAKAGAKAEEAAPKTGAAATTKAGAKAG